MKLSQYIPLIIDKTVTFFSPFRLVSFHRSFLVLVINLPTLKQASYYKMPIEKHV